MSVYSGSSISKAFAERKLLFLVCSEAFQLDVMLKEKEGMLTVSTKVENDVIFMQQATFYN